VRLKFRLNYRIWTRVQAEGKNFLEKHEIAAVRLQGFVDGALQTPTTIRGCECRWSSVTSKISFPLNSA